MPTAEHNLLKIGKVLKSNGTDGELVVSFLNIDPEDINIEEPVFIYFDGLPVPFFIKRFALRGNNKALIKFIGIDSLEDAEEIAGQGVYSADNENVYVDEDDFSFLIGWTLEDGDGIRKGIISDYMDIPGNPCLNIETEKGEMIIPLNEDLIISVDEENRILSMEIPEGLDSL